jgi:dCMP deaminase
MKEHKVLSYLKRAEVVAENSPDEETKVGSILISKSTGSVISEGYNGFVRGADDHRIPKTRPAKYEFVIHAEDNLISNAARNGVRTDNCVAVQTHSPCPQCARRLYQAGIDTVYFKTYYPGTDRIKALGDLILEFTPEGLYTKMVMRPNTDLEIK